MAIGIAKFLGHFTEVSANSLKYDKSDPSKGNYAVVLYFLSMLINDCN